MAPAGAANNGVTQISGVAFFDDGSCDAGQPAGFGDLTILMTGDLDGCWYTKVDFASSKDNGTPSGVYIERGEEIFIGTLNGDPVEFRPTYKFTSKYDPQFIVNDDPLEFGTEVHGRCQHPIVSELSGGITGRVDFKDDVDAGPGEPPLYYRGHIRLPS